ncbi:hypothetical protein HAX54_020903 [Datura stramonium]|uniref:Uncharacterized protein n=1 Tax=Datura stramonium TaxID=4076 RepID=A0ABS8S3I6_DATST|nr:hypothetical protein [Datura stramonium]
MKHHIIFKEGDNEPDFEMGYEMAEEDCAMLLDLFDHYKKEWMSEPLGDYSPEMVQVELISASCRTVTGLINVICKIHGVAKSGRTNRTYQHVQFMNTSVVSDNGAVIILTVAAVKQVNFCGRPTWFTSAISCGSHSDQPLCGD